jgi:HEAT repeat protein
MAAQGSLFSAVDAARETRDVDALIDLLQRGEQMTRVRAARHLGELRAIRAVDPLMKALHASDWLLRMAAMSALAEIRDKRAADEIAAIAHDIDPRAPKGVRDPRVPAVVALRRLGDPRALELMIGIASDQDASSRARRWAINELVELRTEGSLRALRAAVDTMRGINRWRARRAMRKLTGA